MKTEEFASATLRELWRIVKDQIKERTGSCCCDEQTLYNMEKNQVEIGAEREIT